MENRTDDRFSNDRERDDRSIEACECSEASRQSEWCDMSDCDGQVKPPPALAGGTHQQIISHTFNFQHSALPLLNDLSIGQIDFFQ